MHYDEDDDGDVSSGDLDVNVLDVCVIFMRVEHVERMISVGSMIAIDELIY